MSEHQAGLFIIEFTAPYTTSDGRTYNANKSEQILCPDLYRAIEIFRDKHPDGTPHVVRKVSRYSQSLLIDDAFLVGPT